MRNIIAVLVILFFAAPVMAESAKPLELDAVIHADTPYGKATLTKYMLTVYDATLWTDAPIWSMDTTYALSLHYHLHFTAEELAGRSVDEIGRQVTLGKAEADNYNAQLLALFPTVKNGDEITALYQPQKGVTLYYNGKLQGRIPDPVFAKRFMAIWLSDKTSEPEMRKALVGQ